jgi:hypothetical protein
MIYNILKKVIDFIYVNFLRTRYNRWIKRFNLRHLNEIRIE